MSILERGWDKGPARRKRAMWGGMPVPRERWINAVCPILSAILRDERLLERIKNQRAALVLHTFISGVPFSWEEPITPLTDAGMRELRAALVDKGFCP